MLSFQHCERWWWSSPFPGPVAQGSSPQSPWTHILYVIKHGASCNASIYLSPFTALGLVMSRSRPAAWINHGFSVFPLHPLLLSYQRGNCSSGSGRERSLFLVLRTRGSVLADDSCLKVVTFAACQRMCCTWRAGEKSPGTAELLFRLPDFLSSTQWNFSQHFLLAFSLLSCCIFHYL